MQGTVTVTVHSFNFHPVYRKRYRQSHKFLADTAGQKINEGDVVVIAECRPLSKRKRFKVQEVLERAAQVSEIQEEADFAPRRKLGASPAEADVDAKKKKAVPSPVAQ